MAVFYLAMVHAFGGLGAAGEAVDRVTRLVRGSSLPSREPPAHFESSWQARMPSGVRLQPHGDELPWYSDDWGGPR